MPTVVQLRKICKDKGIKGYSGMNKEQLIKYCGDNKTHYITKNIQISNKNKPTPKECDKWLQNKSINPRNKNPISKNGRIDKVLKHNCLKSKQIRTVSRKTHDIGVVSLQPIMKDLTVDELGILDTNYYSTQKIPKQRTHSTIQHKTGPINKKGRQIVPAQIFNTTNLIKSNSNIDTSRFIYDDNYNNWSHHELLQEFNKRKIPIEDPDLILENYRWLVAESLELHDEVPFIYKYYGKKKSFLINEVLKYKENKYSRSFLNSINKRPLEMILFNLEYNYLTIAHSLYKKFLTFPLEIVKKMMIDIKDVNIIMSLCKIPKYQSICNDQTFWKSKIQKHYVQYYKNNQHKNWKVYFMVSIFDGKVLEQNYPVLKKGDLVLWTYGKTFHKVISNPNKTGKLKIIELHTLKNDNGEYVPGDVITPKKTLFISKHGFTYSNTNRHNPAIFIKIDKVPLSL